MQYFTPWNWNVLDLHRLDLAGTESFSIFVICHSNRHSWVDMTFTTVYQQTEWWGSIGSFPSWREKTAHGESKISINKKKDICTITQGKKEKKKEEKELLALCFGESVSRRNYFRYKTHSSQIPQPRAGQLGASKPGELFLSIFLAYMLPHLGWYQQ